MSLLEVASIAGEQWGLVTTAQAASVGASPQMMARWARGERLTRVAHGVYKIAGSPHDPRDDLRAAWLTFDPKHTATERLESRPIDVVVSHRSAANLHDLGDLDADVYEFTVAERRQTRRQDVRIHATKVPAGHDSWTLVGGLPVTSVLVTIRDLAASHTDGGHLAGIVRDAITTAVVDIDDLIDTLRPHAHRYGVPAGDGGALLRRFLAEAGLPRTPQRAAALLEGPALSIAKVAELLRENPELLRQVSARDVAQLLDVLSSPSTQQSLARGQSNRGPLRRR